MMGNNSWSRIRKIAIAAVIAGIVIGLKVINSGDYLTLTYVKESRQHFQELYREQSLTVLAAYAGIYILVTSLSLPGAAVMTLAAGALFGLVAGTVVVSFASTIGATLACAISRFILRDWVQGRFGDRLKTVNEGIEREGAFYLFTLRLIPVFPFWLINLLMGLTTMPLKTFYWVSQAGMLAATIVFVNAGRELGKIESLSGILSPTLILSFILLGLFPLITKKSIAFYKAKKVKNDTLISSLF